MEAWFDYSRFLISLVAIIDPFAVIPVFLAMTGELDPVRQARAARYSIQTVFLVLLIAALSGDMILTVLGTSLDAFRVGGGLILLTMAFGMLRDVVHLEPESALERGRFQESMGVAPLGIPLLAGPGAISATIIQMQRSEGWGHGAAVILCIVL
ncbi:MAG: NAAT family transporter, partial [Magnetococcus sp. WYHC-3]